MPGDVRVGTAGWGIPAQHAGEFPGAGSHLERYAQRLPAVEINSSFYRPHRPATYERWARSVPEGFRFAVKLPREITHARRLVGTAEPLTQFLSDASALGGKLGPLLVQLPPSLRFERTVAEDFFAGLRARHDGAVVCEPRHASWFAGEADALLRGLRMARVAADPAPVPAAALPGGWGRLVYHRLHGSPKMYYSAYSPEYLARLAAGLAGARAAGAEVWCIFDNTAAGAAMTDALAVLALSRKTA